MTRKIAGHTYYRANYFTVDDFTVTDDTVSENNYTYAANIWQRFSIRTLGEYNNLYLKTNVSLLIDILENFCESSVASYGLDRSLLHFARFRVERDVKNIRA